ncbi:hypothetical protein OUZ56_007268 [Daphnia magna]|uniref:Uncharacterized protein n=1 Tax=Daphnia magna TaxID=35525 RepID=A0ABQ9YYL1_9CRUS|nr:hypothetical protein OUZ56_007268 [Daphnia magna]
MTWKVSHIGLYINHTLHKPTPTISIFSTSTRPSAVVSGLPSRLAASSASSRSRSRQNYICGPSCKETAVLHSECHLGIT